MNDDSIAKSSIDAGSIDHRPLREQIAFRMQESILAGELAPGHAIVETEVASHFGVSRAPVREALQILANKGLVEVESYRGTTVRRLAKRDVEEVYEMRSVLEAYAVQHVVRTRAAQVALDLRGWCDAMRDHASQGDWRAVTATDERFHSTLIEAAGNAVLWKFWEDINMHVRRLMALRNMKNENIMQVVENHLPIIEAIERADEAAATELLRVHVATAGDLMLEQDLFDEA